jgi:hypothetical protein
MADTVIVADDFLSNEEFAIVTSVISNRNWHFGHSSSGKLIKEDDGVELYRNLCNDTGNLSYDSYKSRSIPFWYMELSDIDFFSINIVKKIEKFFLKRFKLNRVYACGQSFGQNGNYHQDDTRKNTYTFCLYINEFNSGDQDAVDGHLYIKIPNEKFLLCYQPIKNRGIFFPSRYYHKGTGFTRLSGELRICIAWKLEEI